MGVSLSKENNNTADVCGEVKYFKYIKKIYFRVARVTYA
jgi:hypothetical protein